MNSRVRVLLLPNFGPRVGGGHGIRCLTLGQSLAAAGARVAMGATVEALAALAPFWPAEVESLALGDPLADGAALAAGFGGDLVVVDHYGAGAAFERALAGAGRLLAVIDDLTDRRHDCAVLIDPGLHPAVTDHAFRAPGARVLEGPEFSLLRPAFGAARATALARRGGQVARILLSIGLTDLDGMTVRLARLALDRIGERSLDVVIAAGAQSRPALEALAAADPRLGLHIDTADMAGLMTRADVAIGAGGSSVWERACLGLPSLCIVLADNQAPMAALMAERGLCLTADAREADFENAVAASLDRLLCEADLRASLSARSIALCDGAGAARVAQILLEALA